MSASVRVETTSQPVRRMSAPFRTALILERARPLLASVARAAWTVMRTRIFLKGAVSVALVAVFLAGTRAAESHLRSMKAFQIDPGFMKVHEMPPWLEDDWAETIPNPFEGKRAVNLFEPRLTEKVYDAYRQSPWIENVCFVRKEFPDRLKIRLRIRTPLAAVPFGETYLLVDGHGILLPRTFRRVPDFGFPLLVVEGVEDVPPAPGRAWESDPLEAGLKVAAILASASRKKKIFERIVRIDVSLMQAGRRPGRTEILLYAAEGGGPIEWGFVPGRKPAVELPVEQKLQNLENLLQSVTDMQRVAYATIQFDEPTYRPR